MKKQYIIAICIIAFFTSLIITMNIVKENKLQNTKKEAKISEKVEDECTEEYTKETKIEEVVATKEKVSANSQLIIKKYFKQCDHTINEYVEMPQELVNLTKEEATLLKHLLQEETYTVEDMASTADEADKKELEAQLDVMKAILTKLQL
mgnify:CR=1 FL=1